MEKDFNNDKFKGALFQNFENEAIKAPDFAWNNIEKELFSQKKKTGFYWFSSIMIVCLLSAGSYFLFFQNPSEKLLSKKFSMKELSIDSDRSKPQNVDKNKNETKKITEIATNKDFETTNSTYTIPSKQKTSVQRSSNTEIVNNTSEAVSISSMTANKTDAENSNQAFETPIDTNRNQFQLFRFPYLRPVLAVSVITLKTIITKTIDKNCIQRISFQASVNKGINIRTIDGEFNTQSMKSKTIGERRIPTILKQYQFGMNYHLNEKFAINSGMNFGKTTFQSRWFYRQFYFENGETTVELKTLNGEATLDNEEIVTEIATGDTVLYKLRANYSSSFFSLPIGFSYNFNQNRLSPFIRYAVSLDFHQSPTISLDIQKNGALNNYDLKFQDNTIRFALQQIASVGFDYKINKNWSAILESKLAIPVSKINVGTNYKLKSTYLTLGIGIKYTLPCTYQKQKK